MRCGGTSIVVCRLCIAEFPHAGNYELVVYLGRLHHTGNSEYMKAGGKMTGVLPRGVYSSK